MIALDASALLALMNKEPGWEVVARAATNQDSTISSVNYAEVLQKAARLGVAAEIVDSVMDGLDITVSPFGRLDARLAASLYRHRSGSQPGRQSVPCPGPQSVEPGLHHRPPLGDLGGRVQRRGHDHPLSRSGSLDQSGKARRRGWCRVSLCTSPVDHLARSRGPSCTGSKVRQRQPVILTSCRRWRARPVM